MSSNVVSHSLGRVPIPWLPKLPASQPWTSTQGQQTPIVLNKQRKLEEREGEQEKTSNKQEFAMHEFEAITSPLPPPPPHTHLCSNLHMNQQADCSCLPYTLTRYSLFCNVLKLHLTALLWYLSVVMLSTCWRVAALLFFPLSALLMPGNGLMTGVVAGTTTTSITIQLLMQPTEMENHESGKSWCSV